MPRFAPETGALEGKLKGGMICERGRTEDVRALGLGRHVV